MQHNRVRVPVQKRSIEKKRRIVSAAHAAFAKSGYFAVTIPQIAQRAQLSTGTVYAYFHDKRDILFVCMAQFREDRLANFTERLRELKTTNDLRQSVRDVLDILVNAHSETGRQYYDDLMSLKYTDHEIGEFFDSTIAILTDAIVAKINEHGFVFKHPTEQSMLAGFLINAVQNELSWPRKSKPAYNRDTFIADTADIIVAMVQRADTADPVSRD